VDYVWCISGNGYAITTHNGFTLLFHNLVMRFEPIRHTTINHINRDPLNCCKPNLRTAGKWTQSINHSMGKNNKSGVVGVYYSKGKNVWVATWTSHEEDKCKKTFSVNKYGFEFAWELAIFHRSMVERELLHYIIAFYPDDARCVFNEMFPEYADDDEDEDEEDEEDEDVDNDNQ